MHEQVPAPDATPPAPDLPNPADLAALQQQVLGWFAGAARDLPWRHTRDPYRVLVAEMMLQQTQVERVIPRYAAFLETFPTLEHLAAAPTAEVIRQWAGLGYNRRAINLQRIAQRIRDDYGGSFPQQVAELQKLPGIGPYTAGAVACFAFEHDVAFMDTNIRRVLRRLLGGPDQTPPPADRALLHLAQQLIPVGQGWAWNQAIMEVGALICTSTPACWRCPLRAHCRAYAAWRQADETVFSSAPYQPSPRPARRVAERPAQPFVGSNRYYRGRLLDLLRALPDGSRLPLAELGPQLRNDFDPQEHFDWLRELVAGLARDGLAECGADGLVGLPGS